MKNNSFFILVLNSGSATVKYSLFKADNLVLENEGIVERIGLKGGVKNHEEAVKKILKDLTQVKKIKDLSKIRTVGHRVVHGGEKFKKTTLLNKKKIEELKGYSKLAPLHNPPNIMGIEVCQKLLPQAKQVAVFDTAFHTTLPPSSYIYAIPYKFYSQHQIRRYGFHGISHQYVSERARETVGGKISRLITCHLGGGSSITAIKNGKSVDTSMGFTPLEGLVMESRSGDIDPAIVTYLITELNFTAQEVYDILNKKSGYKGICGKKDFREILKIKSKDRLTRLAYEIFVLSVTKYIGKYIAELGGVDIIVFTAGIGEGSWELRKDVMEHFKFVGIKLDQKKNKNNSLIISAPNSKVKVLVVPDNEALKIAKEAQKITK